MVLCTSAYPLFKFKVGLLIYTYKYTGSESIKNYQHAHIHFSKLKLYCCDILIG